MKKSELMKLKDHYRSGKDNLADDFFKPCMLAATKYRRAVGYFSSSALLSWVEALPRLAVEGGLVIQLIASPELSESDYKTIHNLSSNAQRNEYKEIIVERILDDIACLLETPNNIELRANIFAWLLANDRLEIKFAFAKHIDNPGIFHEKIGIFDFRDDMQVAFTGSANETISGHQRNYESIDVYRSWIETENGRINTKLEQFNEAWKNSAEGLEVIEPSTNMLHRLKSRAQQKPYASNKDVKKIDDTITSKWRHQEEAVAAFMAVGSGVLEMATGTGKTRTAIKILNRLISEGKIKSAIVTTDGTDLLDQWASELDEWNFTGKRQWLIYRHYERHHQLGEFALDTKSSLIVISRGQLHKLLSRLPISAKEHMFIVHDEVHGMGTPSLVENLSGLHAHLPWRIGLSATPERAYDKDGNKFISKELGQTFYKFPLEKAISRGILSEFDYEPLHYELTINDRDRLKKIYVKKAARINSGNPMSKEEIWTEISKVYKTAEMKPEVFEEYLIKKPEILNRAIIFVETKEYGTKILNIVHKHTHLYRTYYAEDDRNYLVEFAQGNIDCLITCHRISQGIDIKSLNTVILFASARAKLETIQRMGRCLRLDSINPNKRATVVDFVRSGNVSDSIPNADQDRKTWLMELSNTKRNTNYGA